MAGIDSKIKMSSEEKQKIKSNSAKTLPLNPTAEGYSGSEVRRRLSHNPLIDLVDEKLGIVFDEIVAHENDESSHRKMIYIGDTPPTGEVRPNLIWIDTSGGES